MRVSRVGGLHAEGQPVQPIRGWRTGWGAYRWDASLGRFERKTGPVRRTGEAYRCPKNMHHPHVPVRGVCV
jgi:hypothetical protein